MNTLAQGLLSHPNPIPASNTCWCNACCSGGCSFTTLRGHWRRGRSGFPYTGGWLKTWEEWGDDGVRRRMGQACEEDSSMTAHTKYPGSDPPSRISADLCWLQSWHIQVDPPGPLNVPAFPSGFLVGSWSAQTQEYMPTSTNNSLHMSELTY